MDFRTDTDRKPTLSRLTGFLVLGLIFLLPIPSAGQTTVTFRLDLTQEIARHFFRPDSDTVELFGNLPPLSTKQGLPMQPAGHSQAAYTVTVQFPAVSAGKVLTFRYALRLNGVVLPEQNAPPRQIVINSGKVLVPVTHLRLKFEMLESRRSYPPAGNRRVVRTSEQRPPGRGRGYRTSQPERPKEPHGGLGATHYPLTQNTELHR